MARTLITPVSLIRETGQDVETPTTIDATLVTNGAKIPYDTNIAGNLLIHVKNTFGSGVTVTIVKTDTGSRASLGNTDVTVAASTGEQMIRVSASRHGQSDGFIYVNFSTGMTGSIMTYLLP